MFFFPRQSLPEPFRRRGIKERFRAAAPVSRKQNETIDFSRHDQVIRASKSIVSSCPAPIWF